MNKNSDWTFEDSVSDEIDAINKKIIDDDTYIGVKILRDYLDYLISGEGSDDDFYYAQSFIERNVASKQSYNTNGGRMVYNAIKHAAELNVLKAS